MGMIAEAVRHMLAAGMPADAVVAAVQAMEAHAPKDEAAERRRAKDRERKAAVRRLPQTSVDSADSADTPLSPPIPSLSSPTPPTNLTLNTPPISPHPSPAEPATKPARVRSLQKASATDFARFWSEYPRRVGKQDAEKAFVRAIGRGADPERIIEGAKRFSKKRYGEDPEFTAHPATWLNRGSWDDEDLWSGPNAAAIDPRFRAAFEEGLRIEEELKRREQSVQTQVA